MEPLGPPLLLSSFWGVFFWQIILHRLSFFGRCPLPFTFLQPTKWSLPSNLSLFNENITMYTFVIVRQVDASSVGWHTDFLESISGISPLVKCGEPCKEHLLIKNINPENMSWMILLTQTPHIWHCAHAFAACSNPPGTLMTFQGTTMRDFLVEPMPKAHLSWGQSRKKLSLSLSNQKTYRKERNTTLSSSFLHRNPRTPVNSTKEKKLNCLQFGFSRGFSTKTTKKNWTLSRVFFHPSSVNSSSSALLRVARWVGTNSPRTWTRLPRAARTSRDGSLPLSEEQAVF